MELWLSLLPRLILDNSNSYIRNCGNYQKNAYFLPETAYLCFKIVFSCLKYFWMGVEGNWTQGFVHARQVPWLVYISNTKILFFLTNIYPTCEVQNYTRTFLKHTEYYIIKICLPYYVINKKFS